MPKMQTERTNPPFLVYAIPYVLRSELLGVYIHLRELLADHGGEVPFSETDG
jgi:hypothetical protein